ncbi:MAG: hypothetical protein MJ252_23710, partial [archaeon]|nr:hypothetical protein [archaeon]
MTDLDPINRREIKKKIKELYCDKFRTFKLPPKFYNTNEHGAHFKYVELYDKLTELMLTLPPERLGNNGKYFENNNETERKESSKKKQKIRLRNNSKLKLNQLMENKKNSSVTSLKFHNKFIFRRNVDEEELDDCLSKENNSKDNYTPLKPKNLFLNTKKLSIFIKKRNIDYDSDLENDNGLNEDKKETKIESTISNNTNMNYFSFNESKSKDSLINIKGLNLFNKSINTL